MPGKTCAVAVCNNRSETCRNLSFHSFPKNVVLREIWIAASRRKGVINWDHMSICSEHFKEEDFSDEMLQRRRLKRDAVPSLKLSGLMVKSIRKQMLKVVEDLTCSDNVQPNGVNVISGGETMQVECTDSYTSTNPAHVTLKPDPDAEGDYKRMYHHVMIDIQHLEKKIALLEYKMNAARKEFKAATKNNAYNLLQKYFTANETARIQNKSAQVKWTHEEIKEAMTLFRLSKKAYLYLRNARGFPLPGLPALKHARTGTSRGKRNIRS